MYEVCQCHHVQDVAVGLHAVGGVVGSPRHHHQPGQEEGQRGAEGVAQLAVHQQAAEAGLLGTGRASTQPSPPGQLIQVQQLTETEWWL